MSKKRQICQKQFTTKVGIGLAPIQLPRVIERGVGVNDSREFELHIGCHWHIPLYHMCIPPSIEKAWGGGGDPSLP